MKSLRGFEILKQRGGLHDASGVGSFYIRRKHSSDTGIGPRKTGAKIPYRRRLCVRSTDVNLVC
jgi:hypothetical protein